MGVGASCNTALSQRMSNFVSGYSHADERVRQQIKLQRQQKHQPFTRASTKTSLPLSATFPTSNPPSRQKSSSQRLEHTPSRLRSQSTANGQPVYDEQLNCAICDPDTFEPQVHKKSVNRSGDSTIATPTSISTDQKSTGESKQPRWMTNEQTRQDLVRTDSLLDNVRRVSSGQRKHEWIEGWRSASEQTHHSHKKAQQTIQRLDAQKEKFTGRMDEVGAYLKAISETSETFHSSLGHNLADSSKHASSHSLDALPAVSSRSSSSLVVVPSVSGHSDSKLVRSFNLLIKIRLLFLNFCFAFSVQRQFEIRFIDQFDHEN